MDITILAAGLGYVGKVTESKPIYVSKDIVMGIEEVLTERFVDFLAMEFPHLIGMVV